MPKFSAHVEALAYGEKQELVSLGEAQYAGIEADTKGAAGAMARILFREERHDLFINPMVFTRVKNLFDEENPPAPVQEAPVEPVPKKTRRKRKSSDDPSQGAAAS